MDEVQAFLARNKHQFGYIMHEASKQWIQKDSVGALTVGPCNIFIEKYGNYHELQDKVEQQQQEIERIIGWCCTECDENFYLPKNSQNEQCLSVIHCPYCGGWGHTVLNTIPEKVK
ncbi:hypothetical protein HRF87_21685 [Bacillus sp. CRN 9]|nr:hypothetical protein [Bacillus sp. CRN 9]